MIFRISICNVSVKFCGFRMRLNTLGGRLLNVDSMRGSHIHYLGGHSMNPCVRWPRETLYRCGEISNSDWIEPVAKARPSARLSSNQGTKSNMDIRPQDLGSVENGSPQRRHTLIDDALVRRADPPTKRPRKAKYCNAGFAKNTSSTDPCLRMAAQKGSRARSSRIPADLPVDVMDASRRVLIRGMHDN